MKVLIAGQYGVFLGQLIDIFHKEGWEVYLLTGEGRPSRRRRNVFEQYYFRYDSESVRDIMDSASPDLLLFAGAFDSAFRQENARRGSMLFLSGLTNLLMLAQLLKVPRFVYLSTHEVFGESCLTPIREDMPPSPVSSRGVLLEQGESLVRRYGESSGLDTVILRLDHLYWMPKDRDDVCETHARLCLSAFQDNVIPASAKQIFSAVYAADAAFSVFQVAAAPTHRDAIYHITSQEEESEIDAARVIREAAGEKVLIKDNTVGLTQKTVLSGKLLEREFGIRARYSYRTQAPLILRHMQRHPKRFAPRGRGRAGFFGRLWERCRTTFWKLVPFAENFLVFIAVFMINNRTADSDFVRYLDVFLLYVVLFAVFYGKRQGIVAALLSVAGFLFRQNYYRQGIEILVDYNTYIWIAQLFIVGMGVGHLRDSLNMVAEDKDEEISFLINQLDDVHAVNSSNLRVKNILEDHILNYDDSLGTLTYLVDQLGRFQKEDVLVRAADAVAEVVGTKDVAIYKVSNADYARLLVSTTDRARSLGKSLKYSAAEPIAAALSRREVFVNRSLREDLPIMGCGLYAEEKLQYILFIWNLPFERVSLHEMDLLKVVGSLIQSAVTREAQYQNALQAERCLPGVSILNEETLEEQLAAGRQAKEKEYFIYSLLRVVEPVPRRAPDGGWVQEDLLAAEHTLTRSIRDTDFIGMGRDGHLRVLVTNAGPEDAAIVMERLRKQGIACELETTD